MKKLLLLLFFITLTHTALANQIPVSSKYGMVVTEQHLASTIGANILKAGGNAIDAAVAVGYALAVVNPCCGNIGGGGFMTVHLANGKNIFINFREKAPLAAKKDMFLDKKGNLIPSKSTEGYLAVAIPGTVLGFETALEKYGTMTRHEVMAGAIELAEKGFILTSGDVQLMEEYADKLKKDPNVAAIFLKNNATYQVGDRLIQKDLANTLKQISAKGSQVFYHGDIAKKIVEASAKNGGILTLKDFQTYNVQELTPIHCTYRGYDIISAPPPSSGGVTLCEMLNILELDSLNQFKNSSAENISLIVEAMRIAYADRNNTLGDPNFVKNPVEKLISKEYAKKARKKILPPKGTPRTGGMDTTHYSIVDKKGNAVAVTYTLNSFFGAEVIAGNTGFFLNNEMDDFTAKVGEKNQFGLVQGAANAIEPGKRPLSSMTPTIILKNNRIFMIVGSPGGPRIITATLQTILNVIDFGMNIQEAVAAPRFHHQWLPDVIDIEPNAISPETKQKLISMGYHLTEQPSWGAVEAILIQPENGIYYGANDKRRPAGKAVGVES